MSEVKFTELPVPSLGERDLEAEEALDAVPITLAEKNSSYALRFR